MTGYSITAAAFSFVTVPAVAVVLPTVAAGFVLVSWSLVLARDHTHRIAVDDGQSYILELTRDTLGAVAWCVLGLILPCQLKIAIVGRACSCLQFLSRTRAIEYSRP